MEYSHDFVAHAGYHLTAADLQQPQAYHTFDQQQTVMHDPYALATQQKFSTDVKPRLSKEQHAILEAHFRANPKPNTSAKKGFAETLGVSLEKVNNWFQNTRAKSKQEAKKKQGSGLFNMPQHSQLSLGTSDSETSPAFASADYFQMMQEHEDTLAFEQPQSTQLLTPDFMVPHAAHDLNDLSDLNRRTLTQEQFDAFAQQEMMLNSGDLAMLSSDPEVLNKLLADAHQPGFAMSVPQEIPEHAAFPAVTMMQEHTISAPASEWIDSRSSSASLSGSYEQHGISSHQWQPGQSIPVDFHQLDREFQKVAQARQDEPAWPDLQRRESSTSLITQSMGNVGLHTPQPTQQATFKSPTPVSSLAARRQRQRPTPLGLASLRSQSYSGTAPPMGSPGQMQPPSTTPPQLRRIKSSNVVGGVGRVQKTVAPPQRSPLNWSFADALTSPQAVRHQSSQSASALAPPTPMSPNELSPEQALKVQQWQHRHASISETEAEHAVSFQNFSSPPHTPMFQTHTQFIPPQIIPGNVIMENTPPQSAPASQQCFPQGIFVPSPQHAQMQQQFQPVPQHMFMPQPQQPHQQQVMHMIDTEQRFQMPAPQFTVTTTGPSMEMPLQFAQNGVPIVDASGQIALAMPSQLQFVQQKITRDHNGIPAGAQMTFQVTSESMPLQVTAQVPKHSTQASSDFFVHEYVPQGERIATPRKAVDTGPKNYTFANHTPEHFEKGKKDNEKASSGSSPEGSLSA